MNSFSSSLGKGGEGGVSRVDVCMGTSTSTCALTSEQRGDGLG